MKALIIGISGQDGSYLAELLLKNGYLVIGTSRDLKKNNFSNLEKLNIFKEVSIVELNILDVAQVEKVIRKHKPDVIYNLSGQTSVGNSFEFVQETYQSIFNGTLNILDTIKSVNSSIKFFNAGSGEIFGGNSEKFSSEVSPIAPLSPYGVAKAASLHLVDNYRKSFDIFCCTGITFNHESPLRAEHFVTQKIIKAAHEISNRKKDNLILGNINIKRDWGWAPDYVNAMKIMMSADKPDNFVIATGVESSLKDFIDHSFKFFNLNYLDYLEVSDEFIRKTDFETNGADPSKINNVLGWKHSYGVNEIVFQMCKSYNYR